MRSRFAKMYIVKWRVSCIESAVTQTFGLVFNNVKPPILGDNTFKDVPVGIDPSTWPLDVNIEYTQDMAKRQNGVLPGGHFKVYGNFCWGGEKGRAEVYFLPAGQQVPAALAGTDVEKAKRTQQQLIAMGMKGSAIEASDTLRRVRRARQGQDPRTARASRPWCAWSSTTTRRAARAASRPTASSS